MRFLLCVALASLVALSPARAADHIWSKSGKNIPLVVANEEVGKVGPFDLYSPDHTKCIEVVFRRGKADEEALPAATVTTHGKKIPLPLDEDWSDVEILWSPDSQSVALTGGLNGYTNSTRIFRLTDEKLALVALKAPQRDMANTYPPCKGDNADERICKGEKNGDQFNYATIAWADATTAVIMGEIPCDSIEGGMMCQVEGYEIDVRSGHILRRVTARELKRRWQSKLAWNLRIPEPPVLKSAK